MDRFALMTLAALAAGCNKEKPADPGNADVTLTAKSLSDGPAQSTDPAWNRPSGRRFVAIQADVLMNTCQTPGLKASEAALVDPGFGRLPASGGAFGDQKATPGTLADTELKPCTDGKTQTAAEFVFLVPDNMDIGGATLSFRGASATLNGLGKM